VFRLVDVGNDHLAEIKLPGRLVTRDRYFTARVKAFDDPQAPARQQAYLSAIASLPTVSIHFGSFLVNEHLLPLSEDDRRRATRNGGTAGTRVAVLKAEEKGSDVNLATQLLVDAYSGEFDEAAVISNDSDLTEPIRHVSKALRPPVWVMNNRGRPARRLIAAGDGFIPLTHQDFAHCQLPNPVTVGARKVSKPPKWSIPPGY